MKNLPLEEIHKTYPDMSPEVLINAVSKRVRQLNSGARPLVRVENRSLSEVAFQEIMEGKLAIHLPEEDHSEAGKKSRRKK